MFNKQNTKYSKVIQKVYFETLIHFHLCVRENTACLKKFMQPFADFIHGFLKVWAEGYSEHSLNSGHELVVYVL